MNRLERLLLRASVASMALLLGTGCGARLTLMQGMLDDSGRTLEQALSAGARNCASAELAKAEAAQRFAEIEFSQGNVLRAEQHIEEVLTWSRAAINATANCAAAAAPTMGPDGPMLTAEYLARATDRDSDRVVDELDHCPDSPEDRDGFEDQDGCPDSDNDQDGIVDLNDACPDEPEDSDGFRDADGCPEPDNDLDGIADEDDDCPDEPETFNNVEDDDGCPDTGYQHFLIDADRIVFTDPISFTNNGSVLSSLSEPILRELTGLLEENESWKIRIEAHTDSRGEVEELRELSEARAVEVEAWLVEYGGISDKRMSHQSYGGAVPVDTNRTTRGRERNNRIEVIIVER